MSPSKAKLIPVLIASTLKPVRDTRAFDKLALSLGETNKYSLNIIGFSPKKPSSDSEIRFFSSMSHFHSPFQRILAQIKFAWRLLQIRPRLLLCCTFEYLPLATFFKPLIGYKLVYDVQENYVANLDLNPSLQPNQRKRLQRIIRAADNVKSVDLYLLAETCYRQEMPEKTPSLVLENKFKGSSTWTSPKIFELKEGYQFFISGTITPQFGVLNAIQWFQIIQKAFPQSRLLIAGHVPIKAFKSQLEILSKANNGITLQVSSEPISHADLIKSLKKSDFALLPYTLHPAIKDKMPTKLYECAALGIPVLITPTPTWQEFLSAFKGGYAIDFLDLNQAIHSFQQALDQEYFSTPAPDTVLWKTEKLHFQEAIQNLLS